MLLKKLTTEDLWNNIAIIKIKINKNVTDETEVEGNERERIARYYVSCLRKIIKSDHLALVLSKCREKKVIKYK